MRAPASGTSPQEPSGVPTKKVLILTWAFATLWWSIFTPPDRTFAARLSLLQPAWALRILRGDGTWSQDLFLLLFLHAAFTLWAGFWSLPRIYNWISTSYYDDAMQVYILVFSMLGVCGLSAGGIAQRGNQIEEREAHGPKREAAIEEALLPPLLVPSKTTHSRMFPQKHSFEYSYLFVGVPVGMTARSSKALSVDGSPPSWFNIRASDYLFRGSKDLSLAEKLQVYLERQGISEGHYSFAYLVTAPRFLGYSFNPVSFWYIYDSDAQLKYMILEVNNTFDERRLYLLRPSSADKDKDLSPPADEPTTNNALYFRETWQKDFHVSPFNSRKGTYSLRAIDPLAAFEQSGHVKVDNTIVLRSDKNHPKLIARVFSTTPPTPALTIPNLALLKFLLSWWSVGFLTFPRIISQASTLFFKKNLYVWFRPEVHPSSLARPYTEDETTLEAIFRAFLTTIVESADKPLRLVYQAAHSNDSELVLYSSAYLREKEHERTLSVKVLSPAFYSRFVHYACAKEAFDREGLVTDEKNRTVLVEPPHLLPVLLDAIKQSTSQNKTKSLPSLHWHIHRLLHCPPAPPIYPSTTTTTTTKIMTGIRTFPPSSLDLFARNSLHIDGAAYRRTTTKLFLAQRFTLGLPVLVTALDVLLRGLLLLAAIVYASRSEVFDVLRPRTHTMGDVGEVGLLLLMGNGVHFWSLVKGEV